MYDKLKNIGKIVDNICGRIISKIGNFSFLEKRGNKCLLPQHSVLREQHYFLQSMSLINEGKRSSNLPTDCHSLSFREPLEDQLTREQCGI